MEKDYVYLTYHQVMVLLYRIEELKKGSPYFNDEIANSFVNLALTKAKEIALSSSIKLKLIPNANKTKLSKSLLNYMINLTGTDIFDEDTLEKYIPIIKEVESTAESRFRKKFGKESSESDNKALR